MIERFPTLRDVKVLSALMEHATAAAAGEGDQPAKRAVQPAKRVQISCREGGAASEEGAQERVVQPAKRSAAERAVQPVKRGPPVTRVQLSRVQGKARGRARKPRDPRIARGPPPSPPKPPWAF